MSGIHVPIHLRAGEECDWLSAPPPSHAEAEAAVAEDRRADQKQDQRGLASAGGEHAKDVWALGSGYGCGGGPPAWAECLGRSQEPPAPYKFPENQDGGGNNKGHALSTESLSSLTHTIHDL